MTTFLAMKWAENKAGKKSKNLTNISETNCRM